MPLSDIVHLAPDRAYTTFKTFIPSFFTQTTEASDNVDTIKAMLVAAGWKQTATNQATAFLSFPLGFPDYTSGLLSTDRLAVIISHNNATAVRYEFFDPRTEADPTASDPNGVITTRGVPIGPTGDDTAVSLVLKIGGGVIWDFYFTSFVGIGATGIALTSYLPGTDGNNFIFTPGVWGADTPISTGGGWVMQSKCQQDIDPTSANTTKTTLSIKTTSLSVLISVLVDGVAPVDFNLEQGLWEAAANDFSAVFLTTQPFGIPDIYAFNSFLYCGSLYTPADLRLSKVGFVMFQKETPKQLGIGGSFTDTKTGVDGKQTSGAWGQAGFSFCFYHYVGFDGTHHNLQTRMGKSIFVPALVMMPTHPAEFDPFDLVDESRVVGYFWDSFIATEYQKVGTLIVQEGQTYRAIFAQQASPIGTLFLAWPVKPPSQGVPPPAPLPDFVGTANVFGVGVTRLTGDPFTADLVGRVLYINHSAYRVDAVIDPDHLNLSTAAGIQTNVPFNTAG